MAFYENTIVAKQDLTEKDLRGMHGLFQDLENFQIKSGNAH